MGSNDFVTCLIISITLNALGCAEYVVNSVIVRDPTLRRVLEEEEELDRKEKKLKKAKKTKSKINLHSNTQTEIHAPNFGRKLVTLFLTQILGWFTLGSISARGLDSSSATTWDQLGPLILVHAGKHCYLGFVSAVGERYVGGAIHHFVTATCLIHMTQFSPITMGIASVMVIAELGDFHHDLVRILSPLTESSTCRRAMLSTFVVLAFCRLLLPFAATIIAVVSKDIKYFGRMEVIVFFFSTTYFFILSGWFVTSALRNLRQVWPFCTKSSIIAPTLVPPMSNNSNYHTNLIPKVINHTDLTGDPKKVHDTIVSLSDIYAKDSYGSDTSNGNMNGNETLEKVHRKISLTQV